MIFAEEGEPSLLGVVTLEEALLAVDPGICVVCGAPPIPDNIRCETCAEKHRVSRRQSQQRAINERDQASGQTTFL